MPHRVPSPRELVMHTQSIMQNALIKKKLEEQRENFRKRQDQQQQQQQIQQRPSTPVNSPAKQTMSPTPLAFTPTSVLRKMTADKEPEGANHLNHQVEPIFSISSLYHNNQGSFHKLQNRCISTLQLCQFSDSINKPITCVFKWQENHFNNASSIAYTMGMSNRSNNLGIEESALKTKYLCSLVHNQDSNDNPNLNMLKEGKLIVDNIKSSDKSTRLKEINAILDKNSKVMEAIALKDKECIKLSIRDSSISKIFV